MAKPSVLTPENMRRLIEARWRRIEKHWNSDFFQKHGGGAIEYVLNETRDELVSAFEREVDGCESPLEAAFVVWWVALTRTRFDGIGLRRQVEVQAGGRSWRLDCQPFAYSNGVYAALPASGNEPMIAVELDGHEFHERTKEQVTLRNQRDRALLSAGWTVLHVSGSEFNANPEEVVYGIYQDVRDRFMAALRSVESGAEAD